MLKKKMVRPKKSSEQLSISLQGLSVDWFILLKVVCRQPQRFNPAEIQECCNSIYTDEEEFLSGPPGPPCYSNLSVISSRKLPYIGQ